MTDPTVVIDLIEAFRRSKTMFAAVQMELFDRMPAEPGQLAADLGAKPAALERLLDGCVSLGLLSKTQGRYSNTPVAEEYLRRSSPCSLAGYVVYSDEVLYPMWGHLVNAVREGRPRWRQTFGVGHIFEGFYKTDADMREFLRGMHGFGLLSSPPVAEAFDLSGFKRMVDLGGGTGHLAAACSARWPELKVAVFDLPKVLEVTRNYAPDGIEAIPGDFFADRLPDADLFALGRILHDWDDTKIALLLGRIHARLPAGGGLLIAEKLLEEDKGGPVPACMQSLNMLVCTEGRERSAAEYQELLHAAGFKRVEVKRTGAPLDALLAVRD